MEMIAVWKVKTFLVVAITVRTVCVKRNRTRDCLSPGSERKNGCSAMKEKSLV